MKRNFDIDETPQLETKCDVKDWISPLVHNEIEQINLFYFILSPETSCYHIQVDLYI